MSESAWRSQALGDLSLVIKDGTHGSFRRVRQGIPLLSAKNVTESGAVSWDETDDRISEEDYRAITSSFSPQKDDVLITIVGTLGRRAIFDGAKVAFQRSVAFVRPDQCRISPGFLYHAVGAPEYVQQLVRRSNATAQAGLYLGELVQTTVPLPPDLDEQRRIEAVLDLTHQAISKTDAVIGKLKKLRAGLLHDFCTCGLDENGHRRDPACNPAAFKESAFGRIPRSWEVVRVDEVAARGTGHTPDKDNPSYWNGGVKWVSLADSHRLDRIFISETDKEISDLGIANSSAVKHPSGTVILSRDAGVGKSAILAETMAVSQHFITWTCGRRLNNLFLYYWLQHNKREFESIAMGSTIKTIGLPFFKRLQIALPSRPEQDAASSILFELDGLIGSNEKELKKQQMLQCGLRADLLTGLVRVPQERPASEAHA
jgi:type I restriction enzyme S subunit